MRPRLMILVVAGLVATCLVGPGAASALSREGPVLAQQSGEQGGAGQGEEAEQSAQDGGGEGQSGQEAETDPGSGEETEEETTPWTYQMSKITLVLIVLALLALGLLYYRFVVVRQREGG